jgi:hypothetical protein
LEFVRKEVYLGAAFSSHTFEAAFAQFRSMYNVAPLRAVCSPDVLARFCELYERSGAVAHLHSSRLRYEGVPLVAAVMPAGTVAFEGEVEENRMGDW